MQTLEEINPVNTIDLYIKLREFSFNSKEQALYIQKDFYEEKSDSILDIEEIIYRLNLACFLSKSNNLILIKSKSLFRDNMYGLGNISAHKIIHNFKNFARLPRIKINNCSHNKDHFFSETESHLIRHLTKFNHNYCKRSNYVNQLPFSVCYLLSKGICVQNEKS
jgi:hypothetical protein